MMWLGNFGRNIKFRADCVGQEPSSDIWAGYKELEALGHKRTSKESRDLHMVTNENTGRQMSTEQRISSWAVVAAAPRRDRKVIRE